MSNVNIIEIEEDKNLQEGTPDYSNLMTEEQKRRGQYYSQCYLTRRGEVDAKYKNEWDYLQMQYECQRTPDAEDEDYPNSFIPLTTPTVEGQVASMMESDIDFRHVTNNPGHETYMSKLDAASELYRRKNNFKQHFKDFARGYDLLGNAFVTISWEKTRNGAKKGLSGIPRISIPNVLSVLVDGRIKDYKDLQYAEYIIHEIGYQTVAWARQEFGDDYANALSTESNRQEGYDPDQSADDSHTFMLLHVWTRTNKNNNLQLIRMDSNGLIFKESDPKKPYYENVDNEYPFGMARMMPKLGCFYGFGDGAILKPMQECVNKLADELELAARFSAQGRTYVDKKAHMAPSQITSDPSKIILCDDPNQNIFVTEGKGVNNIIFNMISFLLRESQRATRFHDAMTGNQQGTSATATQINTQLAQGNVGIKDKKADLSDVMGWADMYALKLCLQYWKTPFWSSLGRDSSEWIDPEGMKNVPDTVPATKNTFDKILKDIDEKKIENVPSVPYFETAKKESGEIIKNALDFSTKVIIGESVPKGAIPLYNMILGLGQMKVMDKDGKIVPLVTAKRLEELIEELIGIKLKTQSEEREQKANMSPFNTTIANQINPVGDNNTVQVPTVNQGLQQNVPQMPNNDSRKVS